MFLANNRLEVVLCPNVFALLFIIAVFHVSSSTDLAASGLSGKNKRRGKRDLMKIEMISLQKQKQEARGDDPTANRREKEKMKNVYFIKS